MVMTVMTVYVWNCSEYGDVGATWMGGCYNERAAICENCVEELGEFVSFVFAEVLKALISRR